MQTISTSSAAAVTPLPATVRSAHWLSATAIVLAYLLAWTREILSADDLRQTLLTLHRQLGLLVLVLLAARLASRWRDGASGADADLPAYLRWGASASHVALYGLLLAQPLLGWAMTSAQGHAVRFLGLVPLPALATADPDLADTLQEWHEWGASALMAVVVLHFLAALWHHLVRRDGVLSAMAPWVRPLPRKPRSD